MALERLYLAVNCVKQTEKLYAASSDSRTSRCGKHQLDGIAWSLGDFDYFLTNRLCGFPTLHHRFRSNGWYKRIAFKIRRIEDAWNFMRFLFCYRGLEANES